MKKILMGLGLFACGLSASAQNGLENIVVEKYYVSNAADAAGSAGVLPVGSVTYRVFADMLPGYKLQAVYGVSGTINHTLIVQTSTKFFNNEDYGSTTPSISTANVRKNSALLDSYFSVGGAAAGRMAVLKSEDTDGSPGNAQNILQNNASPMQGGPINIGTTTSLSAFDGMIPGTPEAVTYVGISATDLASFDGTSQAGNGIVETDGSIASLNGSVGPTAANRVLIGQFTTDGIFHFELNIQIGTPGGGVQNFVANNPVTGEISIASLTGTFGAPNTPPVVSISAPTTGATFILGTSVPFNVTATDADGTVDSVEFFVDNVKVGSDLSSPYSINWTATPAGVHSLTAKATDNGGTVVTSSPVTVTVGNIIPPAVNITSPVTGTTFFDGVSVNIAANATDADGTVDSVVFYVDNVRLSADASAPYGATWTSVIGTHQLTARAYDNDGASTLSSIVTIQVFSSSASYALMSTSSTCDENVFCLPLNALAPVSNVIGYDIQLNYDNTKVQPTGVVTVGNALINPNYVSTANSINNAAGTMYITVFFNATAPPTAAFTGSGQLLCVEFVKTAGFQAVDNAQFSVAALQESYFTGVQPKIASPGSFSSFQDTIFHSSLRFWLNNSPIKYNAAVPADYVITNIYGSNGSCSSLSAAAVQPDMSGNFSYNTNNGQSISIRKDIAGTTDVQPVVNGFDAFLTRRVLVNDASFVPTVYQMIAMDVNIDGVVSAGDLSQINQRTVLMIPEYKQAWNYNSSGVSDGRPSKDWTFIDGTTLNSNPAYLISSTYPANDGIGYSKSKVPVVPFCLAVPTFTSTVCATLGSETYKGILLGDVNGNFADYNNNPNAFRLGDGNKVVFDVAHAEISGHTVRVPVKVFSEEPVHALDFSLQFNNEKLTFLSVESTTSIESLSNLNESDRTLRFTSWSLGAMDIAAAPAYVSFDLKGNSITAEDLLSLNAYLNGEKVVAETGARLAGNEAMVNVYPNPAHDVLNVVASEDAVVLLTDMAGREVILQKQAEANRRLEIPTDGIANGFYVLKVYNEGFVSTTKVVVAH